MARGPLAQGQEGGSHLEATTLPCVVFHGRSYAHRHVAVGHALDFFCYSAERSL